MSFVVIGASAGGITVLRQIFKEVVPPLTMPIAVVLHMRSGPKIEYDHLFSLPIGLKADEADDKQRPESGHIYVAPPGYHLLFEGDGTMALSVDPPVNWARPSIDVAFETAASAFGSSLVGILLTGANADGAAGLKAIQELGGTTIVQDPTTAEFSAMPASALKLLTPNHLMHPTEIGNYINTLSQDLMAP